METLSYRGLDLVSLWEAASDLLSRTVPHYLSPCWYTLDAPSLLITSHFSPDIPEIPAEWLTQEYFEDDVNRLAQVAASPTGISTLHEATGGKPETSKRWHQNMAYGGDQELIAALVGKDGRAWGAVGLYREPGQPHFDPDELETVRSLARHAAEGARRALTLGEAGDPETADAPAVLVLDKDWDIESATPTASSWVDDLPGGAWDKTRLPTSVMAVATRASADNGRREKPEVLVRTRSGVWAAVSGFPLLGGPPSVAILMERAAPHRLTPLLMAIYGLTRREQEVTLLVLEGNSTSSIARKLHLSGYTVQEHLKRVFTKMGVRSRRELTGKIFFDCYEPRVRDNEQRAAEGAHLRGGPRFG